MLGLFSAIVSGGVLLMFSTYLAVSGQSGNLTVLILLLLVALSGVAAWAAITRRPIVLIIAFLISFVPVGFYLSLVGSWVRLAGLAQLGYAVAAIMMLRHRRAENSEHE
jgi:hypothetical protein